MEKVKQEIVPSVDASIQSRVKQEIDSGIGFVLWLASANDLIPPWWSKRRDIELRNFWKRVDYLSGAIYTLESRMTTIPFKIVPKDNSIEAHVRQAAKFEEILNDASEFGAGWGTFFGKWIEDILTQDNGSFAEIIGPGEPDGPLMGAPFSIANLDSARCIRTSNPEFPVLYQDREGGKFKLHHTRVAFASLMTSPIEEMHGVGFCGVSRCINTAQHLLDILIYKQEKLGSRPQRNVLIAKGGLSPDNIKSAFGMADEVMDNQRLSRYSKSVVIGSPDLPDAAIDQIDLATLPDGFDEQTSVTLGMATIALAFGVDARELFPAQGVGATKADALVQHLKSRGKGIGQLLEISEREFAQKFLPPYLKLEFDFQDDAQDKQVAEIKKIRSDRHTVDLTNETVDERVVREQMLADGDLTQAQFEELELRSGRLPDGATALSLFHSQEHKEMLALGVPDPLNIEANDAEIMKGVISDKRTKLIEMLGLLHAPNKISPKFPVLGSGGKNVHKVRKLIKESMTALMVLLAEYEDALGKEAIAAMQESIGDEEGDEETPDEDEAEVDDEEAGGTERPFDLKNIDSFGLSVRAAIRGAWRGEFDFLQFTDTLNSAIFRGYEQAWREGAAQCGIRPEDRTPTEQARLDQEITSDLTHVPALFDFVFANSKENDGKLGRSLTRAEMWTNRYNFVVGLAQQISCADQKYQWRVGPTEHCRDCLTYDGRIYRGSTWAAVGAQPQSRRLECGGYRCQCALVLVTSPSVRAWPGRPPAPIG